MTYNIRLLQVSSYCLMLVIPTVYAGVSFNPAFLAGDDNAVADLNYFASGSSLKPGSYKVDLYVNKTFIRNQSVRFEVGEKNEKDLQPVFTRKELEGLGVNVKSTHWTDDMQESDVLSLEKAMDDAHAIPDMDHLRLDLSIPQAALLNTARGYIPPEQWDQGINAFLLNYSVSGNKNYASSGEARSHFASIQPGLNIGPWRLRNNSSWSQNSNDSGSTSDWENISTTLERNVQSLEGELTIGDTSTQGTLFDSVPVRGVRLASDENMLPDSQKGFAPTIKGIAKSNAKVTIKQNGYTLYQTYVSPGAFEINDLFPTASSGDLQVSVLESDGSSSTFTVPYSTVTGLQREGHINYSFIAGRYRSASSEQSAPSLLQGTLFWGGGYGITLYGGMQYAEKFQSVSLGIGKNLGQLGAVSVDVTTAKSILADSSEHLGSSARFLYAKSLNDIGTTLNLLGYRYSTQGYYTFSDTTYKKMSGYNTPDTNKEEKDDKVDYADYYNLTYTKKGKLQVSVNQSLDSFGSLYISGTQQSYWHTDSKDNWLQAGYNTNIGDVSVGVSYSLNKYATQPNTDQVLALSFSLPLGKWLSTTGQDGRVKNNSYLSYSNSRDGEGHMTQNIGVNGTLLDDNNMNYSVQKSADNESSDAQGMISVGYRGTYNNLSVGYNNNGNNRQINYNVAGGAIVHRNGITFSQPLGDTNVLVSAPGASGTNLENNSGVKTDWRGYAVVPYASTYRLNRIALNTASLDKHVDLESNVVNVVPTKGAVVRAQFDARVGIRAIITLMKDGHPLPFGTIVTEGDSGAGGIVGDDGQVYLTGLPLKGKIRAQWGGNNTQQCSAPFNISQSEVNKSITDFTLLCQVN
uniref:Fimbrial biogenesis usher protein n=1 Tax=Pseudomonas tritici TaxID=2745518 RepID=A0A8I0D0T8_9PSED